MNPIQKRPCSETIEGEPPPKKHQTEQTLEEKVDKLYLEVMGDYDHDNKWVIGDFAVDSGLFAAGNTFYVGSWWIGRLFDTIKHNPEDPKIWDLVFKKIALPSLTIPLGHGHVYILPKLLWEHQSNILKDFPKNEDISSESIQTFIHCLQRCLSNHLLTQENCQNVMKLAKRYSIQWLFTECMQFSLEEEPYKIWHQFFKYKDSNLCNLNFKEVREFISHLLSKEPKSLPHLLDVIKLIYPSEVDNEDLTVCFNADQKLTLPIYLWKAHSDYSWIKATTLQEEQHIPQESIEAFVQCLAQCTSFNILNLSNYAHLIELADKYQVAWLREDCENFYEVHILSQAAQCRFSSKIRQFVAWLARNKTPLHPNVRKALDQIADEYQLVDLKLYTSGFSLDFLPEGTLFVKMPTKFEWLRSDMTPLEPNKPERALLAKCLAMENHWYSQKIELTIQNESEDSFSQEDFEEINKILDATKYPTIIRLDFSEDTTCVNLSNRVGQYPNLKHLKIVVHDLGIIDHLLELIRENKTLESLSIIINDSIYYEKEAKDGFYGEEYGYSEKVITQAIQKALKESATLKEIPLIYSNYQLNDIRTCIEDGNLIRNYVIRQDEIEED